MERVEESKQRSRASGEGEKRENMGYTLREEEEDNDILGVFKFIFFKCCIEIKCIRSFGLKDKRKIILGI